MCGLLFALTPVHESRASEAIAVTTSSVVSFGGEGGDTFGLEEISRRNVVVLLNPRGEDCTLRFPLEIGETVLLRGGPGDQPHILCEAALVSTENGSTAKFSYSCSEHAPTDEPKCPKAAEFTASPAR